MASAIILTNSHLVRTRRRPTICSLCNSSSSSSISPNFHSLAWNPQLGISPFAQWRWSGLRQLGIPISQQSLTLVRRSKHRSKIIVASLFGVGAPEALVIGVVALLVFGPKGLAEVARNLGKTLRAFQPTIRELQDVSREFQSTIEKEIGLDEIRNPMQSNYSSTTTSPISRPAPVATPEDSQATIDPNGIPSPKKPYSSEDYLKITEEQLKAAASRQQKEQTPPSVPSTEFKPQIQAQDTLQEGSAATPPPEQKPKDEP